MPETGPEIGAGVSATVAATHLEACAAELAVTGVGTVADLAEVLRRLTASQRHLAAALTHLAGLVRDGDAEGLATAPAPDLEALTEVLHAAATASGCAADALAESAPVLRTLVRTDDENTHL
ncbi:hypothetical protein SAMN05421810_101148 [Amycolatopsis arida]|uniref:Uncharacterized protein n=1 Tax=Amycolatopsis arida TaxID=587909 RepID=A0A1I5KH45_9PSEU|nr:hypothetical protein [Amycolatopsis arida]TDX97044.1 hypothetical protein CLV69_102146 [Amycolatopsis arida]SFO84359.1 hypothetical protein SAMN05421810_101148 [Amycolatopsis arida]